MESNLTRKVIGCAIEVHRQLGGGLLESAYEKCLCHELTLNDIQFVTQVPVPIVYKGLRIESAFRLDLLIENQLVIELKATENILPIHKAQLLSYLKMTNIELGLLINFNVTKLTKGILRMVN